MPKVRYDGMISEVRLGKTSLLASMSGLLAHLLLLWESAGCYSAYSTLFAFPLDMERSVCLFVRRSMR